MHEIKIFSNIKFGNLQKSNSTKFHIKFSLKLILKKFNLRLYRFI